MKHLLAPSTAVHRISSLTFLPGALVFNRKPITRVKTVRYR